MAYYLKDLPFTEEGKKLKLSDEDRERFRLVYKKNGESWTLHDIWGEGGDYGDDCIVVPLQSSYRGWEWWNAGVDFSNVTGSANDPRPWGISSWINLWRCVYTIVNGAPSPVICCTDGCMYYNMDNRNPDVLHVDHYTPGDLHGGHVIQGQVSVTPVPGSLVYIVPVCNRHNLRRNNGYMKTGQGWTFAVGLFFGFNQLVNGYLAQRPLEIHEKI